MGAAKLQFPGHVKMSAKDIQGCSEPASKTHKGRQLVLVFLFICQGPKFSPWYPFMLWGTWDAPGHQTSGSAPNQA